MRIAISQRVEWLSEREERRDCLDQAWPARLDNLGYCPCPMPNSLSDPVAWAKSTNVDGLLLTGGNDLAHVPEADAPAPERDRTEQALLDLAADRSMPVLAHCRGLQMMNVYLGGDLSSCTGHVATRHSIAWKEGGETETSGVNSYHNWGVTEAGLADETTVLAVADDGTVEAFCHERLPWLALMWHPERERDLHPRDRWLITECFTPRRTQ